MNPYTVVRLPGSVDYIRSENGFWTALDYHCVDCAGDDPYYTDDTLPQPYEVLSIGVRTPEEGAVDL